MILCQTVDGIHLQMPNSLRFVKIEITSRPSRAFKICPIVQVLSYKYDQNPTWILTTIMELICLGRIRNQQWVNSINTQFFFKRHKITHTCKQNKALSWSVLVPYRHSKTLDFLDTYVLGRCPVFPPTLSNFRSPHVWRILKCFPPIRWVALGDNPDLQCNQARKVHIKIIGKVKKCYQYIGNWYRTFHSLVLHTALLYGFLFLKIYFQEVTKSC